MPAKLTTIVIHVEGGIVQGVVADAPVTYIVCDTDTDCGDELARVPDEMQKHVASEEMHDPKLCVADVDSAAVNAMIKTV